MEVTDYDLTRKIRSSLADYARSNLMFSKRRNFTQEELEDAGVRAFKARTLGFCKDQRLIKINELSDLFMDMGIFRNESEFEELKEKLSRVKLDYKNQYSINFNLHNIHSERYCNIQKEEIPYKDD